VAYIEAYFILTAADTGSEDEAGETK
jgi:hypothetical protein